MSRGLALILLSAGGFVRIRVCKLCAALIVERGADQHDRVHRACPPVPTTGERP